MTPLEANEEARVALANAKWNCEKARIEADVLECLLATAEREAKLREACEDYLEWVRTPHHSQPIEETVKQRWEILERMEATLEPKGGEA